MYYQRLVSLYIVLTPLLWMLGLLIPLGALLVVWLLLAGVSKKTSCLKISWAWWLVCLMQIVSVVSNWLASRETIGFLFYRLLSSPVSGWFFLGAALSVGKFHRLHSARIVRAISALGVYFLLFGITAFLAGIWLRLDSLEIVSPIGRLLPSWLPSVANYFTMRFFIMDEPFGISVPRLILFYPWSVCLGFAAIAVFFVTLNERNTRWRILGATGALFALISSYSRSAVIGFALCCAAYVWLRLPTGFKWASISAASLALIPFLVIGNVDSTTREAFELVSEFRGGSTEARMMGYEAVRASLRVYPLLGRGWPGEYVSAGIPMPVGSHSSIYGVLYTGGLLTFIPFCIALTATVCSMLRRGLHGSATDRSAFFIAFSLVVLSPFEGIYSFVLPALFAFLWMGAALRDTRGINTSPLLPSTKTSRTQ